MLIPDIVRLLTLEEKAQLCTGSSNWFSREIDRLKIPSILMADGPHGVRKAVGFEFGKAEPATCFPTASAMGDSWNVDLLFEAGKTIGIECQSLGVHILLGPGANIKRSPLGGRNFEYYSEDPVLSGELAAAFINGVQSEGVGTSLKHFTANNQEFQRMVNSSEVDERTLREIYLPAFEIAIKKSSPWTIMAAYNQVNGAFATENSYLLDTILKKEWKYKGFVVSDWGAVYDRVAGIKAGMHLEMPGNPQNTPVIVEAVKSGQLSEKRLDEVVTTFLEIVFKAISLQREQVEFDTEKHHQVARKVAGESIVLLKNEEKLLPLDPDKHLRIAVVGQFAKKPRYQGGGSSQMVPTKLENAWDELNVLGGKEFQFQYADGYDAEHQTNPQLLDEVTAVSGKSDLVLTFVGLPDHFESEAFDRQHLDIPLSHLQVIGRAIQSGKEVVVVLSNGSAIEMSAWSDRVKGIVKAGLLGQGGGGAIAEMLLGITNPSGRISESYPLKLEDNPSFLAFPGNDRKVHYAEGIFVGYRHYDIRKMNVLFPFGHGLSYVEFEYCDLQVNSAIIDEKSELTVSFDLKNLGDREGKEVAQLYVRDLKSRIIRPEKELKGFLKCRLAPGENRRVSYTLDPRAFAYFDPKYKQWVTESGEFEILVGHSSRDIRLTTRITVNSSQQFKPVFDKYSTLGEILSDEHGGTVLLPIVKMIASAMGENFESLTQNDFMYHILMAMPLSKLVNFSNGLFNQEALNYLLEQLNPS